MFTTKDCLSHISYCEIFVWNNFVLEVLLGVSEATLQSN